MEPTEHEAEAQEAQEARAAPRCTGTRCAGRPPGIKNNIPRTASHFRGHGRGRAACAEDQGYGGTRFVEDNLAGASNGQGPPSITDRLRSAADGAQAAADLIEAAGLAAAQAFRSQLPQDAAEYVRLNVLPVRAR